MTGTTLPLLEVRHLTVGFPTERGLALAARDVSFNVPQGSCLGLVGESGCGKSVTLRALINLVPKPGQALAGEVLWDGRNLLTASSQEIIRIRGNDISMVFQDATVSLNPVIPVGDQISEVLRVKRHMGGHDSHVEAIRLLDRVGIPMPSRRMRDYPHQLSGGMCQRVMIAIAIACRPRLLLADEPTTALDVTIQDQILTLLDDLRGETGMAMILVSHDLGVVAERADRIAVMYAGRIVEEGPVRSVIESPRHPYAYGLLGAVPSLDLRGRGRPLAAIPGQPPSLASTIDGCPFAPRCAGARPECLAVTMELVEDPDGHRTACPFVDDISWDTAIPDGALLQERDEPSAKAEPDADEPLLQVRDAVKSFTGRRTVLEYLRRRRGVRTIALDRVSLDLRRHEVLGLVGESGSGKTTLARCLVGLVKPDAGQIRAFGTDVVPSRADDLRGVRRRMQVVYQDPYSSLNPRMSIRAAVGEAARVHGLATRASEGKRVNELLEMVGLPTKVAEWLPRELSGGQRQRVAIARALAVQPEVLIADEAVSALDVSVQAQVLNLFADLTQELGLSMVFITHQLSVIAHVADRVAVMYLGRVVERGTVEDIFLRPAHPYTIGLLRAIPGLGKRRSRELAIAGDTASRERLATGCQFRERCPMAQAVCQSQDPVPVFLGGEHFAECLLLPQASRGLVPPLTPALTLAATGVPDPAAQVAAFPGDSSVAQREAD